MFKLFPVLVVALTSLVSLSSNFDEVVFGDDIVEEKVHAGFGTRFLLEVIDSKEVKGPYQKLLTLGKISVSAQKLEPQNKNETKRTRITFEAWRATGFTSREKVKTLVVDCFEDNRIMDGAPTKYRIVSDN